MLLLSRSRLHAHSKSQGIGGLSHATGVKDVGEVVPQENRGTAPRGKDVRKLKAAGLQEVPGSPVVRTLLCPGPKFNT